MTRVLHLIKVTSIAGAETHLLTLLPGLRAQGFDARLLVLVEPGKPMHDFLQLAAERDVPAESVVIQRDLAPHLVPHLRDRFRASAPRIIHTHLQHADLYGIPAARLARVPAIVSTRHNENAFRRRLPLKLTNRMLWRMVKAGIAISDSVRRFAIEVEGAPQHCVHTIYYGLPVDPTRDEQRPHLRTVIRETLNIPPDAPVVGMACRLVEQKGVAYGLQAFQQIAARFPQARLVIAGDGPLRKLLENEARPLGEQVHFLGWRDDVPQLMAAFDVFLMPSLWEGFGLVALEAMAQRVPVIASAVSSLPEIIVPGETGLLVSPRDTAALAEALTLLLSDRALALHMGLMGEDRLETHFSASRMVEQTARLYHALA